MKEEITEKLEKIKKIVSNQEELEQVMVVVSDLVGLFTDKLVEVNERQLKLEEKMEDVFDVLSQIEEEMIENMNHEFEAECPYCGEEIPFQLPAEGDEIECPHCGNTIELELLLDEEGCGCGSCGGCQGCGQDTEESDGSNEEENE